MKIRNDFVSNSSSCSFIISVETDDDVIQLREKLKYLKDKCCGLMFTNSVKNAMHSQFEYILDNKNQIEKGIYILVDNGEDHDYLDGFTDFYGNLQDIADEINSGYGKLKFYQDNDAHVSLGCNLEYKQEN